MFVPIGGSREGLCSKLNFGSKNQNSMGLSRLTATLTSSPEELLGRQRGCQAVATTLGADAVQLPQDFKRGSRSRSFFQFLIKWTGYIEPSWIEYRVASKLIQFPGYVTRFPNLRMD